MVIIIIRVQHFLGSWYRCGERLAEIIGLADCRFCLVGCPTFVTLNGIKVSCRQAGLTCIQSVHKQIRYFPIKMPYIHFDYFCLIFVRI